MSSVSGVKEVDGRLVAIARDIEPPTGWTNDFETLGGEAMWGSCGDIQALFERVGIETTEVKPLYTMEPRTGEALVMMEAGSPTAFYLYNLIEGSLYQITQPDDLTKIVESIGDRGLASLEVKQIC